MVDDKIWVWHLSLVDNIIYTNTFPYNPLSEFNVEGPFYNLDQINELNYLFKLSDKPDLECNPDDKYLQVYKLEKQIKGLLEAKNCC